MKFGLAFASSIGTEGSSAVEICKLAEQVGFESVWGGEHVIFPSSIESKYPYTCLLYTSPSPRDGLLSRMPSSA